MKNISINIPLAGKILSNVLLAQKILDKKIDINFQKNNQNNPHINLLSGIINKKNLERLITDTKETNSIIRKKKYEIKSNGIGVLIFENPVIYLRYYKNDFFNLIRESFKDKKYFENIDKTTSNLLWFPKTTIANKDTNIKILSDTLELIDKINFYETFIVKQICLIEFSSDYPEKKII